MLLSGCFGQSRGPVISEFAVRKLREREERLTVTRRVLKERPGRGLDRENLLVIPSKGRAIYAKVERQRAERAATAKPESKPAIQSDAWRRDRLASGARAPETYHAAPEAIGAGRI